MQAAPQNVGRSTKKKEKNYSGTNLEKLPAQARSLDSVRAVSCFTLHCRKNARWNEDSATLAKPTTPTRAARSDPNARFQKQPESLSRLQPAERSGERVGKSCNIVVKLHSKLHKKPHNELHNHLCGPVRGTENFQFSANEGHRVFTIFATGGIEFQIIIVQRKHNLRNGKF